MMTQAKVSNKISALKAAATSVSSRVNLKTAAIPVRDNKISTPERKIDHIRFWNPQYSLIHSGFSKNEKAKSLSSKYLHRKIMNKWKKYC